MAGESSEQKKQKKSEDVQFDPSVTGFSDVAISVNPFSTGVNESVVVLYDETRVVDGPDRGSANKVELKEVGSKQKSVSSEDPPEFALVPVGPSSGQNLSPAFSVPPAETTSSPVLAGGKFTLFMRPRTAYGASLVNGKANEPNPTRDFALAGVLGVTALGLIIGGGVHGNIFVVVAGLFMLGAALYFWNRALSAEKTQSGGEHDVSDSISYFPPHMPIMH